MRVVCGSGTLDLLWLIDRLEAKWNAFDARAAGRDGEGLLRGRAVPASGPDRAVAFNE